VLIEVNCESDFVARTRISSACATTWPCHIRPLDTRMCARGSHQKSGPRARRLQSQQPRRVNPSRSSKKIVNRKMKSTRKLPLRTATY